MPQQTTVGTCCCQSGQTCGACAGLPNTLHITISGTGCADGTYALMWNGTNAWTYGPTGVVCGNCSLSISLACVSGVFQLTIQLHNP